MAPLRLEISGLTLSEDSIEAGREVWVEAEMLGLATKAQLSTMRQPSDASVVFDFAFEVSADAASAALRGAIESADEEDADVTFTLLSPGARKKPRELASGFINLKGILEEGRDFLSDVPLTDGSRAIGTLTGVRLVAVEALKVAAEALKLSPMQKSYGGILLGDMAKNPYADRSKKKGSGASGCLAMIFCTCGAESED